MLRTALFASGVLLLMNQAAMACVDANCPQSQSARIKPQNIAQFMRQQAASTRGVTLRFARSYGRTKQVHKTRITHNRHGLSKPPASVSLAASTRQKLRSAPIKRARHQLRYVARSKPIMAFQPAATSL